MMQAHGHTITWLGDGPKHWCNPNLRDQAERVLNKTLLEVDLSVPVHLCRNTLTEIYEVYMDPDDFGEVHCKCKGLRKYQQYESAAGLLQIDLVLGSNGFTVQDTLGKLITERLRLMRNAIGEVSLKVDRNARRREDVRLDTRTKLTSQE